MTDKTVEDGEHDAHYDTHHQSHVEGLAGRSVRLEDYVIKLAFQSHIRHEFIPSFLDSHISFVIVKKIALF